MANIDPNEDRARSELEHLRELRALYQEDLGAENQGKLVPTLFVWGFSLLSFFGTYVGLRNIIRAGDVASGAGQWAGDLAVAGLVALATLAMVHYLQRMLSDKPWTASGFTFLVVYGLLAFFSITFGFAFYWERLEARRQSVEIATTRLEEFVSEIAITGDALELAIDGMITLEADFDRLAEVERLNGGTCGDQSPPGPGPRMRHRVRRAEEMRSQVALLQQAFAQIQDPLRDMETVVPIVQRLADPDVDPETLSLEIEGSTPGATPPAPDAAETDAENAGAAAGLAAAFTGDTSAENRRRILRDARRVALRARAAINRMAADETVAAVAATFNAWGEEYVTPNLVRADDPRGTQYICESTDAGTMLLAAARRLRNLPTVDAPELPDFAGPQATREAVDRMLGSAGAVVGLSRLPQLASNDGPDPGDPGFRAGFSAGRRAEPEDGGGAVATAYAPRLRADDTFPLFVAIIVDTLLFFSAVAGLPRRSHFRRMRNQIRDAMDERYNPFDIPEMREQIESRPGWQALKRFRCDLDDSVMFAVPREMSVDKASIALDTLRLWIAQGVAKRVRVNASTVERLLTEGGNSEMLEELHEKSAGRSPKFFVVQILQDKYNLALLQAILRGLPPGPDDRSGVRHAHPEEWTPRKVLREARRSLWSRLGGLFSSRRAKADEAGDGAQRRARDHDDGLEGYDIPDDDDRRDR